MAEAKKELVIFDDIKEALGIAKEDTGFDAELSMYISDGLDTLKQLGAVDEQMEYDESMKWSEVISIPSDWTPPPYGMARLFVLLNTKLTFDPPSPSNVSYVKAKIDQLAWRIREEYSYTG